MGILLWTLVILLLGGVSRWFQVFLNTRDHFKLNLSKLFFLVSTHTPALLWSSLRKWKQSGARREMSGITRPEESLVLTRITVIMISDNDE